MVDGNTQQMHEWTRLRVNPMSAPYHKSIPKERTIDYIEFPIYGNKRAIEVRKYENGKSVGVKVFEDYDEANSYISRFIGQSIDGSRK